MSTPKTQESDFEQTSSVKTPHYGILFSIPLLMTQMSFTRWESLFVYGPLVFLSLTGMAVINIVAEGSEKAQRLKPSSKILARILFWAASLAAPALAYFGSPGAALLTLTIILAVATYLEFVHLLKVNHTTTDTFFAAIVSYLLLAFTFGAFYSLIAVTTDSAFIEGGQPLQPQQGILHEMIYFSLTTLTTLGYGDITPAPHSIRFLVSLEAVFGQLFLAVVVARIVGLSITAKLSPSGAPTSSDGDSDSGEGQTKTPPGK